MQTGENKLRKENYLFDIIQEINKEIETYKEREKDQTPTQEIKRYYLIATNPYNLKLPVENYELALKEVRKLNS